jgi:hypothetical protein
VKGDVRARSATCCGQAAWPSVGQEMPGRNAWLDAWRPTDQFTIAIWPPSMLLQMLCMCCRCMRLAVLPASRKRSSGWRTQRPACRLWQHAAVAAVLGVWQHRGRLRSSSHLAARCSRALSCRSLSGCVKGSSATCKTSAAACRCDGWPLVAARSETTPVHASTAVQPSSGDPACTA